MRRTNGFWMSIGLLGILMVGAHAAGRLNTASAEEPATTEQHAGRIEDRSLVCMIDDNLQSKPGIEYIYEGKTYYLCCMGCFKRFNTDPERFSHATDPVSGEQVDKADAPIYVYQHRAYFFSTEAHLEAFAENPQAYLATATPAQSPEVNQGKGL